MKGVVKMEHIPTEKIIAFLEIDELNEDTINLSKEVNTHLCKCEQCRKLVDALDNINQAFESLVFEKLRKNRIEKRM